MTSRRLTAGLIPPALTLILLLATRPLEGPPRFDGAGYATLSRSIYEGKGYRAINQPDEPRHAHFPPGYPAFLTPIWWLAGGDKARFTTVAHAASVVLTVMSVGLFARWYQRVEPGAAARWLGLGLAVNWTWIRNGGAIRSEPLAIFLMAVALSAEIRARRTGRMIDALLLGICLGLGMLTRHAVAPFAIAILASYATSGRKRGAATAGLASLGCLAPWIVWLANVRSKTQAELLSLVDLPARVGGQSLFYARRMPDVIIGPVVEVATVFGRSPTLAISATTFAIGFAAVASLGWFTSAISSTRRRLAGLVPLATMPLLIVWPFTEAGRFLIPLVPFVLVGLVEGIARVAGRRLGGQPRTLTAFFVFSVSLPYSFYQVISDRAGADRARQGGFDAACAWLAERDDRRGVIMARHPADVYWMSGRRAVEFPDDLGQLGRTIEGYGVSTILDDSGRYARSEELGISALVNDLPGYRLREVHREGVAAIIYDVSRTAR